MNEVWTIVFEPLPFLHHDLSLLELKLAFLVSDTQVDILSLGNVFC